jgi:hypothetical protein
MKSILSLIEEENQKKNWKAVDTETGEEIVFLKTEKNPPLKEGRKYRFFTVK